MENYELRVIIEKAELEIKINAILLFMDSAPDFDGLSNYEKDLMQQQCDIMVEYKDILSKRIR